MFIQQLFEDNAKRIIVTYPGRFQPFHKGHAEVFANLQRQFGNENVFIVTGNKTDAVKSPFNFSDKVRFMHAMGIPNHQIIETDKVYDLPGRFEPIRDQIVFITVVGAPDANRLNPGATKKDGSQSYFQNIPQSKNEFETADKHGYVIIEPEHPETIVLGGKRYDVSHGTPTRELWNTIRDNPQQRGEFVAQLYGRADSDLANTLDKIPTGAAPAPEPAKKMKNVKKDLTKVQHDPNAEQPVAEAGNRGYDHGFASPTAPSLGGQRRREDDEYHVPDPVDTSIWYIRANGKIIKDKMGTPFQFRSKEAARKSAMTMMAKPFNAGKKFVLTTKPEDEAPVTESVTHRIGLTVTDPNHPMVSKRGETYHKTVRVKGDDREKAINGAIAHYRRKGYKVHDHHYIGTVDDVPMAETGKGISKDAETKFHSKLDALVHDTFGKRKSEKNIAEFAPPGSGDDGNDGFSDETLKRMAAQWYNGDEDPRVEKTLMAAGWEIGQDEGYDDEPGVFVVQAGDVNGNSYMSWPANELRQGMAEGSELKQAKRKYNQAAKDANADQVGAGKKIDTMKKSLRQKDVAKQGVAEDTLDEAVGMMIKGAAISGANDQDIADRIAAKTGGRVDSGSYGHHILIIYPTTQHRAEAAVKIRKMFPGIELYKSGGNRNAIDEQGMAEGKKPDNYHIVDKDGKPASLASYADKTSAEKDRDAKHPGAEVRQVGPRGKVKGVSEGLPQTLRKVVPGYAKREIDKKMDAEKFGRTDVDRDANYWRYKKIQDKLKGQGVAEGAESMTPNWAKYVLDQIYNSDGTVTLTDLFDEGIPGLHDMFMDIAQQHGLDPEEEFEEVQHELTLELEDLIKGGHDIDETGLGLDHKRNRFRSLSVHENAEQLSVGDPVVITGQGIEFEGKTGDIDSFGEGNRFVVVNLYNHGKHSFHSSDVSYNDYADEQDDLDEDLYQYDKEDPYNSEFAPRAGMGRMTLRGWKQQMIKRTAELAQQMAAAGQDIDKSALWDNVHAKLKSMNMDPIAQEIEQAQAELEKIRQRGGVRSRAFGK